MTEAVKRNTEAPTARAARERFHPLVRAARGVLFDAGGTLVHPDWERLALLAEEESGRRFATEELRRVVKRIMRVTDDCLHKGTALPFDTHRRGWVFQQMYRALGLDETHCAGLATRADAAHGERHLWCGLDEEAPRVIAALKGAGWRVGVISNTEDGRLRELLELVEIASHFEILVDSFIVGQRKPGAAIFHLALAQLGLRPDEAVYVGDSYGHDALGARRAGLSAILLDPLDLYGDSDCARIRSLGELIGAS